MSEPEPGVFESARRKPFPAASRNPRWQPWKPGMRQERCVGHKFPAHEVREFVFVDGVPVPNPDRRSATELKHGPLVLAHTMVDGQCRGCLERGMQLGPAVREVREAEAAVEPPPALFELAAPEAEAAPLEFRVDSRRRAR